MKVCYSTVSPYVIVMISTAPASLSDYNSVLNSHILFLDKEGILFKVKK